MAGWLAWSKLNDDEVSGIYPEENTTKKKLNKYITAVMLAWLTALEISSGLVIQDNPRYMQYSAY